MVSGDTIGLWTVVRPTAIRSGLRYWLCRCSCSVEHEVREYTLKNGLSSSCSLCSKHARRRTTPYVPKPRTREYNAWRAMRDRCCLPSVRSYPDYGGRGISVCERWKTSFACFLEDMGKCPPGLTIDRIDNDGNYEPGNCRWATYSEQNRNKRSAHLVTAFGTTMTISDWSDKIGLKRGTILFRLRHGWAPESAVSQPVLAPVAGCDGGTP